MQSSNQPLVSIILPVYNAQNHIARCIESIRAQTYRNFQLIILNDGSRDVSLPVCEMYRKVDSRILLVDKDNSGVSDTRNLGLRLAEGEYVQFVDSDDYLDPGYTASLVRAAEENRADLVIAPYHMVIPRPEAPGRRLREKLSTLLPGELQPAGALPEREPPEVRTYNFLAPGVYDTDSFALHLMDKPASYYYSVLWNKLYRRDILTSGRCFLSAPSTGPRTWCSTCNISSTPAGSFPSTPPAITTSRTLRAWSTPRSARRAIVKMKTTVFPYYKALYEKLGLYEQNKAAIRRYLVDISESSLPSGPLEDAVTGAMEKWDDLTAGMASAADKA